jgi:hypothetical protein
MIILDKQSPTVSEPAWEIMGRIPRPPRFVIFCSYGNDSIALIQWAYEQGLKDVVVVYSDTNWAARWWQNRVEWLEFWVHSLGFWTDRTSSIGFVELALQKKGFPSNRYQWCSYILKIEPGSRWLEETDPEKRAICLVGVRREESQARADFPRFLLNSENHGGRVMVSPLADFTEVERDALLERAGLSPLPHRSMECSPCINSNRADLKALSEEEVDRVEGVENMINDAFGLTKNGKRRTLFRPGLKMGAVGIREVVKWAKAGHGKYVPSEDGVDLTEDMFEPEADQLTCNNGYCSN